MNLFNFDASNEYLLIHIKLTFSFFETYSSFECNTLSGLFYDFSANSNSSNKIIDIGKFSLLISFVFNFSSKELYLPSAISNNFIISSGLFDSVP